MPPVKNSGVQTEKDVAISGFFLDKTTEHVIKELTREHDPSTRQLESIAITAAIIAADKTLEAPTRWTPPVEVTRLKNPTPGGLPVYQIPGGGQRVSLNPPAGSVLVGSQGKGVTGVRTNQGKGFGKVELFQWEKGTLPRTQLPPTPLDRIRNIAASGLRGFGPAVAIAPLTSTPEPDTGVGLTSFGVAGAIGVAITGTPPGLVIAPAVYTLGNVLAAIKLNNAGPKAFDLPPDPGVVAYIAAVNAEQSHKHNLGQPNDP